MASVVCCTMVVEVLLLGPGASAWATERTPGPTASTLESPCPPNESPWCAASGSPSCASGSVSSTVSTAEPANTVSAVSPSGRDGSPRRLWHPLVEEVLPRGIASAAPAASPPPSERDQRQGEDPVPNRRPNQVPEPDQKAHKGSMTEPVGRVLRVLPLGTGLAFVGLGIGFLALRLRRN
jgi:hypothetical protein